MTDLKNNLEEVWREDFNRIWSVLRHFWEFPSSDVELAYKHEARKIYREGKLSSYVEIKQLEQELQKTRNQLESANAVIHHVVYSTEDSQGLAYEYLELNKSKEINNEK